MQPAAIESLSVSPDSGPAGSAATLGIQWSPSAVEDCPEGTAQVRVNGEPDGDPVGPSDSETTVLVEIPDLPDGEMTISVTPTEEPGRVLASIEFDIADDDSDDAVSPGLLAIAVLLVLVAALAVQRLYGKRKARYGRT